MAMYHSRCGRIVSNVILLLLVVWILTISMSEDFINGGFAEFGV